MAHAVPTGGSAVTPVAGRGASRAASKLDASDLLFYVYLLVLVIEYLGLGSQIPLLKVTRLPTLMAWGMFMAVLALGGWRVVAFSRQGRLLVAFMALTAATIAWALVRTYVAAELRFHLDYIGLFAGTAFLLDRPARVRRLSVVMSLVLLVLVASNIDKMSSEVRAGAFRAGYFLADGNDFGWALVALLPFPAYLALRKGSVFTRIFGLTAAGATVAGIVGTGSRGATLAFAGAGLYYWLVLSRRKALTAAALVVVAAGVLILAPGRYVERMRTIDDYQEDSSAQGRLRAWKAAVSMAVDHPLGVGAGNFNSAYGRFYVPEDAQGWGVRRWISAHSVYFKVLGEYGFLGLMLLVAIIALNLRDNHLTLARLRATASDDSDVTVWPAVINIGIVGYAVAGMFLGGVAYPHIFVLSGLTVGCRALAARVPLMGDILPEPATASPVPPTDPVARLGRLHQREGRRPETTEVPRDTERIENPARLLLGAPPTAIKPPWPGAVA